MPMFSGYKMLVAAARFVQMLFRMAKANYTQSWSYFYVCNFVDATFYIWSAWDRGGTIIIEEMTCKVLWNVSVQGNLSDKSCFFMRAGEGRVGVGGGGEGGWLEKGKF